MWKNTVEPASPQTTIWRMRIACCVTKATNTRSEYITLIAFPLQQWLHESAPMLGYTYIVSNCLLWCRVKQVNQEHGQVMKCIDQDLSITELHQIFSILLVTSKYSAHILSERLTFVCRQCKPICIWCSICTPCTAVTWRMATYNVFVSQDLILNYTETNTSETFTILELTVAGSQNGHSSAHVVFLSFNCSGFYCLRFWDAVEHYQQQILGGGEKKAKKGN
jgi:hypothetical protein